MSRAKFLAKFKNLKFWQFYKICNFDFVLFWLGIWCESLVWVIMGRRGVSQNAGVLVVLVSSTPTFSSWRNNGKYKYISDDLSGKKNQGLIKNMDIYICLFLCLLSIHQYFYVNGEDKCRWPFCLIQQLCVVHIMGQFIGLSAGSIECLN